MRSCHYVARSFGLLKSMLGRQPISASQRLANATEFGQPTSECVRVRACRIGIGGRVAVKLAVDPSLNPGTLLRTMHSWAELIMGRACLGYRRRITVNARFIFNRDTPANSMPQTHPLPLTQTAAARFLDQFDRWESVRSECANGIIMIDLRTSFRIGRIMEATDDANAAAIWRAVVEQAPRTELEAANAFWGAVAQWRNSCYHFQSGYLSDLGAHYGGFFWFHNVSNTIPFLLISSSAQTIRRHGKF